MTKKERFEKIMAALKEIAPWAWSEGAVIVVPENVHEKPERMGPSSYFKSWSCLCHKDEEFWGGLSHALRQNNVEVEAFFVKLDDWSERGNLHECLTLSDGRLRPVENTTFCMSFDTLRNVIASSL